jgi:hypothetical protein
LSAPLPLIQGGSMNPKAVIGAAILALISLAQQPAPDKPVQQQLPVEEQNAILKLEVENQDMQTVYSNCNAQVKGMDEKYQANMKEIEKDKAEGLKKLGLDPSTHDVNIKTFYVFDKQPAPKAPEKK